MAAEVSIQSCETCPACGSWCANAVKDSRVHKLGRKRRRRCDTCNTAWQTIEVSGNLVRSLVGIAPLLDELDTVISTVRAKLRAAETVASEVEEEG